MDVDSVHANIERACTDTEIGTPGKYAQVFKSAEKDDHYPSSVKKLSAPSLSTGNRCHTLLSGQGALIASLICTG